MVEGYTVCTGKGTPRTSDHRYSGEGTLSGRMRVRVKLDRFNLDRNFWAGIYRRERWRDSTTTQEDVLEGSAFDLRERRRGRER